MNLSVYEMLDKIDKESVNKKKIERLHEYAKNKALMVILDLTFDPAWQWLLPEGTPPYNPTPKEADLQHVLKSDHRRLQYFINTPHGNAIKPLRRETMFIEMLESVAHDDAKLLIVAKAKKLPFKSITKKLVSEAFPEQTKGW